MEMVDMVITKNWFSGPKSRSVNNFFQPGDAMEGTGTAHFTSSSLTIWKSVRTLNARRMFRKY